MAQQLLTARAYLTALVNGLVGAGRVVTLALAKGHPTLIPVSTSVPPYSGVKPCGQKDRSGRPFSHEPWFGAMNMSRPRAGRSAVS